MNNDRYEKVKKNANSCATRVEFIKKFNADYHWASKYRVISEVTAHMTHGKQKYTNEDILMEAQKHNNSSSFKTASPNLFDAACCRGINRFNSHMTPKIRDLTKSEIQEIARKYRTLKDFRENDWGAYQKAWKERWLEGLGLIKSKRDPFKDSELITIVAKYSSRTSFQKNEPSAYNAAYNKVNGTEFLNTICGHMKKSEHKIGTEYEIYAFINENLNQAYVGLTSNLNKRLNDHLSEVNHCNSKTIVNLEDTKLEILESGLKTADDASRAEKEHYEKLKKKNYDMLNDESRLGLTGGGAKKYTHKKILQICNKYQELSVFREEQSSLYQTIKREKKLDEYTGHMNRKITFRTDQEIKDEIKNNCISCLGELKKYDTKLHAVVKRRGKSFYAPLFPNPKRKLWSQEEIIKLASKNTSKDFSKKYRHLSRKAIKEKFSEKLIFKVA